MRQLTVFLAMVAIGAGAFFWNTRDGLTTAAAEGSGPKIAHNVYFSLKDSSPEAQAKLVEACNTHLRELPGTLFFAVGTVAEYDRPVNDRDWQVGLHVVFNDAAAHDEYQKAPKHLQFIEENKENWAKVRVFDTEYK